VCIHICSGNISWTADGANAQVRIVSLCPTHTEDLATSFPRLRKWRISFSVFITDFIDPGAPCCFAFNPLMHASRIASILYKTVPVVRIVSLEITSRALINTGNAGAGHVGHKTLRHVDTSAPQNWCRSLSRITDGAVSHRNCPGSKCPGFSSITALVSKCLVPCFWCRSVLRPVPKCPRVSWCRSVLWPKCPVTGNAQLLLRNCCLSKYASYYTAI